MKKSELEKRLRKAGCFLLKSGGRHDMWKNPRTGKIDWVPRHAGEVAVGTANSILKNLSA
ncbi:type II toxin-antitoxin system HicA family toxin [Prevotella sp.]|uniref:type II toxin-antitoxin system HicA family toxin n=1 Tax=Prevotella sp. TaxID=59823 RepID=UPI0025E3111E|nr:type II toxin-antitoxin system HicA family toxin [Prevotella sp.]